MITGTAAAERRVGFVFSGQGSQRAGMAAGLHQASPVFAAVFDRVCGLLEARLGEPVADVVLGRAYPERADETLFAQTGLFAVQAGLVALLAGCGIVPQAVAGHSVGEVAAAYVAGVLSLEDACTLVSARARLMQALPGGGAMCAIAAPEAEVKAALAGMDAVSLAAVNGPAATVISGDAEAVAEVAAGFIERGVRMKELRVSHAFHSARMDPVLVELAEVAGSLAYQAPALPWVSGLTGELTTGCEPGYWPRQAREAVRFADTVTAMAAQGVTTFLEVGPDGTLSALGPAALSPADGSQEQPVFVPAQRPGELAVPALMAALAAAFARGVPVDWAAVVPVGRQVELPTYAFQRRRFWPRPGGGTGDVRGAGLTATGHPLLGAAVELADGGVVLTGRLSVPSQPWLADHVVSGTMLFPGTGFVELAAQAGDTAGCPVVDELMVEAPLVLPASGGVQVRVTVGGGTPRTVEIHARAEGTQAWRRHASGVLVTAAALAGGAGDVAVWPPAARNRRPPDRTPGHLLAGRPGRLRPASR
jgi:acyl transferase domain-containing protein